MSTYRLGQVARMWAVLLALTAVLLPLAWGGAQVRAQGGTEEPQPVTEAPDATEPPPDTHIFGYSTTLRFPLLIGFVLNLDVPVEEIVAAALTVRQPSGYERRIVLDPPADFTSDTGPGYTYFRYDWFLLDELPLTPFLPVDYTWEVETTDGMLSSLSDTFVLVDSDAGTWRTTGTPPLVLHSYKSSLAAERMQQEVLAAYDLLSRRTGASPLFEFVIYEPTADYCMTVQDKTTGEESSVVISDNQIVYPCAASDYDELYQHAGITVVHRSNASFTDLEDLMIKAMVQQVYDDLWDTADVPAWFMSGLASLYGLHPNLAALTQARAAIAQGTLLDYAALGVEPSSDAGPQANQTWNAESFLLTLYLADHYGAETPFDLARAIPDSEGGFDAALKDLTGMDLEALWDPFVAWLGSPAADRAATWTPYLPVTPTPTVSPSPTPVTPTLTPTITPPPTATFTPTPPVVPQPTAIVRLATATLLASPTNTPLPPGSLPTLGPTAASPADGESANSDVDPVAIAVIAVAAVVGLLVLWIGIRSLRRRSV